MATLELEADFVKGLRLMFSTSRDAPDALRTMLDEAIRAKYGTTKSLGTFQPTKIKVESLNVKWVILQQRDCIFNYAIILKVEEEYSSSHILTERNSDDSCSSKDDDDDGGLDLEMMEEDLACAVCGYINLKLHKLGKNACACI